MTNCQAVPNRCRRGAAFTAAVCALLALGAPFRGASGQEPATVDSMLFRDGPRQYAGPPEKLRITGRPYRFDFSDRTRKYGGSGWWSHYPVGFVSEAIDGSTIRYTLEPFENGILLAHSNTGIAGGILGFEGSPVFEAEIGSTEATFAGETEVLSSRGYSAAPGEYVPFVITLELRDGATWQPGIFDTAFSYIIQGRVDFVPPPPIPAGASFAGIGHLSDSQYASSSLAGLSFDGSVATGSASPNQTFLWEGGSLTGIGIPAGAYTTSGPGISSDGSTLIGTAYSSSSVGEAFAWTRDEGFAGLGFLPGDVDSFAYDVSADGGVVVGSSRDASHVSEPFRWEDGVMTGLGFLPGGSERAAATGVSADGSVIVGFSQSAAAPADEFEAFWWTAETGMVGLGSLPDGDGASIAQDVSADGSVVVGATSTADVVIEAFRWTPETGMIGLCDLPICDLGADSWAYGVSDDGEVVVGLVNGEPFLWNQEYGMRLIDDVLEIFYDLDLGYWDIGYGTPAISGDGRTIGGTGRNPDGRIEAWIAAIPDFDCVDGADNDGDGLTDEDDPACDGPTDDSELPRNDVPIDIDPWSATNRINLSIPGIVFVAVLGSENFDVGHVDAETLVFGPATAPGGAPLVRVWGPQDSWDVNRDGFADLLGHFRTRETGIAFGDTEACLRGEVDGTAFESCDAILTWRPCGLGFELALLLPVLMWIRGRRRHRGG